MEAIIEQLIADFHERPLPSLTRRDVRIFQVISDLLAKGVPKESILYLNLEDERVLPMEASDLHLMLDVYLRCYPHLRDIPCTFFFDEIQNIPGWHAF